MIRFTRGNPPYNAGDEATFPSEVERRFVARGLAVPAGEAVAASPAPIEQPPQPAPEPVPEPVQRAVPTTRADLDERYEELYGKPPSTWWKDETVTAKIRSAEQESE